MDIVRLLKIESTAKGSQNDLGHTEINPKEDYAAVKGLAFEESLEKIIDLDSSGNIRFKDSSNPEGKSLKSFSDDIASESRARSNAIDAEAQARSDEDARLDRDKYAANNPSGFETPTQLNNRDTANRERGNHTGTQLSSTISNFAATVRNTVLTGIVFTVSSAIVATDTLLAALGKLQAQLNSAYVSTTPENIGVANSAGTTAALARANHVHKLIIPSYEVRETALAQTTSTNADVALAGMLIRPIAGIYDLLAFAQPKHNTAGNLTYYAIYVGGVEVTNTRLDIERSSGLVATPASGDYVMSVSQLSLNGSQDVEIRWRSGGGTARTYGRFLKLTRVG